MYIMGSAIAHVFFSLRLTKVYFCPGGDGIIDLLRCLGVTRLGGYFVVASQVWTRAARTEGIAELQV